MFQFTHPARGATWLWLCDLACLRIVSIHAPREGCDYQVFVGEVSLLEVSIHAPREGCDYYGIGLDNGQLSFNSRTPRGVRRELVVRFGYSSEVSIHAPREGCDMSNRVRRINGIVSIHAPREGCDG